MPIITQRSPLSTLLGVLHREGPPALVLLLVLIFWRDAFDAGYIKVTVLQAGLWLLGGVWLARMLHQGQLELRIGWAGLFVLLWATSGLLSYVLTPYPASAEMEIIRLASSLFIFLLFTNIIEGLDSTRRLVLGIIAVAMVEAGVGILQFFNLDPFGFHFPQGHKKVVGTLGHPNLLAAFLVAALPLAISSLVSSRGKARWAYLIITATIVLAIVFTMSRGGVLGLMAALVVLWALFRFLRVIPGGGQARRRFVRRAVVVGVTSLAVIAFILARAFHLITPMEVDRLTNLDSRSVQVRLLAWEGALDIYSSSPVFGRGLGTFDVLFPQFRPEALLKVEPSNDVILAHTENEYLEVLAEQGFVGLVIFLMAMGAVYIIVIRRLRQIRHVDQARLAAAALAGMSGLLVHNGVCINLRFPASWVMLWTLAALAVSLASSKSISLSADLPWRGAPPPWGIRALAMLLVVASLAAGLTLAVPSLVGQVHLGRGVRLLEEKDYIASVDRLEQARGWIPEEVELHYKLGYVYYKTQQYENALEAFRTVHQLSPNYANVHYNMARVYYDLERDEQAGKMAQVATDLNPYNADAVKLLAISFLRRRQFGQARDTFDRYLQLQPHDTQARVLLGEVLMLMQNWRNAMLEFRELARLEPDNEDVYLHLGMCHLRMDDLKEAQRAYEKAWEIEPKSKIAMEQLIRVHEAQGDWDGAARMRGRLQDLEEK